jgi:hypothetical protein
MIEGRLESLGPDGVFVGWLRDADSAGPAVVRIELGSQMVAEATARAFRPDVMMAGHGHGHYGFAARLHVALPPGAMAFSLAVPARDFRQLGQPFGVPRLVAPESASVAALVHGERQWTVAEFAAAPGCLGLAAERAAMGTARFVDVTFQFALRRWPSEAEAQVYCAALDEDRLAPDAMLGELLASRERADLGPALASPWDPDFPYGLGGRAPSVAVGRRRRR